MKENTRIRCLSCGYGNKQYEGTEEIRHVDIKIDLADLPSKPCPNEKCGELTLVKA